MTDLPNEETAQEKPRLRIVASQEFTCNPEELSYWLDPANESDIFEALTMAHAVGEPPKDANPYGIKLGFQVQKLNGFVWETMQDFGPPSI